MGGGRAKENSDRRAERGKLSGTAGRPTASAAARGQAELWLVTMTIHTVRFGSKAGAGPKISANNRPGLWNFQMVPSLQVQAALTSQGWVVKP